jgi:hypothetical protein
VILICQNLQEKVNDILDDMEADNNEEFASLEVLQRRLAGVITQLVALDAKNTAVATVVCREMDWDPEIMLREYDRVLTDLGAADRLIRSTKDKPSKD